MTENEILKKQIEERELLHNQLKVLAEKSSDSTGDELVRYSEAMISIFNSLR